MILKYWQEAKMAYTEMEEDEEKSENEQKRKDKGTGSQKEDSDMWKTSIISGKQLFLVDSLYGPLFL